MTESTMNVLPLPMIRMEPAACWPFTTMTAMDGRGVVAAAVLSLLVGYGVRCRYETKIEIATTTIADK
jgi:hypothetical protein